jgi:hypothetical protein
VNALFTALALTSILGGVAGASEERKVILAHEEWYRARPVPESTWRGTLRRRQVVEGPLGRTALRYSLVTDGGVIPVYDPDDRLAPFVDSALVVRGKLVDLTAEGFGRELWPGSVVRPSHRTSADAPCVAQSRLHHTALRK